MVEFNRKLYGRKKGRRLSFSSRSLITNLLPKIEIKKTSIKKDLNTLKHKTINQKIFLEIGFGSGELLSKLAVNKKNWYFIGSEPYINGVVHLLKEIQNKELSNISLFLDDGFILLENLSNSSIDEMAILFPDPWHKKKHVNRRFINFNSLKQISRVLKPNAIVTLASDNWIAQNWILKNFSDSGLFEWLIEKSEDWKSSPFNWPKTKYMKKGIASENLPAWFLFKNFK